MCTTTFVALLGLAAACPAGVPTDLLAPTDPRVETRWAPPPSPTAGVKKYQPVEAGNWLKDDNQAAPKPGGMQDMPGMRGMDMKGMKGMDMPGMGGGR